MSEENNQHIEFTNIVVEGIERMDPPQLLPDVDEYIVYRQMGLGKEVNICVTMNIDPQTSDTYYGAQPYKGYRFKELVDGKTPEHGVTPKVCGPNVLGKINTYSLNGLAHSIEYHLEQHSTMGTKKRSIKLIFPTIILLTKEEMDSCTHPETYEEEGNSWGGCSGSCQVEYLIKCKRCERTIKTRGEYFD